MSVAPCLFSASSTATVRLSVAAVCQTESLRSSRLEKQQNKSPFLSVPFLGWLISDVCFTVQSHKILLWYKQQTSELESRFGAKKLLLS